MKSISRFIVRTGSALALAGILALAVFAPARAAASNRFEYHNAPFVFRHLELRQDATMIGIEDPGFRALLKRLGTYVTWKPGARYVLITTAQPQVISFSVGNVNYDVGPVTSQTQVAPYFQGSEVYLPLNAVLHALYLAPKRASGETVLQPQIGSLNIENDGNRVTVVAHAGIALHPRVVSETTLRIVYEFDGVGSTLPRSRSVGAGGIRNITLETHGTARTPKTLLTLNLTADAQHGAAHSDNGSDFAVSFSGSSTVSGPVAPIASIAPVANAAPAQVLPAPTPLGVAQVTSVTVQPASDGMTVTIAVAGNATYSWHRLRAPDNRFWVDIVGAQLAGPPLQQAEPNPVVDVRARQITPTTVRIALSLIGQNALGISPSPTGLTIAVGNQEVADATRAGSGSVGDVVSVSEAQPLVTPAPPGETNPVQGPWKFGPHSTYVPTNPKLIVIDPGHGGSDRGAIRHGTSEATLNLDMAQRLRDILVARGWQVQLTHTADVDVYAPNDTARQELQARDDIANNDGARMLISIHCNSYINSGPTGTTTFYAKPSDLPLAQIMNQNVSSDGTKDDGIVKSHLYIPLHARMPSVLVETAFLSNPSDYALLTSPDWRQKIAEDMANGIDQYAREFPLSGSSAQ